MATNKKRQTKAQALQMSVAELKASAALLGYELRKKGVKREKKNVTDADGRTVKTTYFPHFAIGGSCYARTWKLFDTAKAVFHFEPEQNGEVWEQKLLLGCEHIVRFLKHEINDTQMQTAIRRLVTPLPKAEYIKRGGSKTAKAGDK